MKVRWKEVNDVFEGLIQEKLSREDIALWASKRMFANDGDDLEFDPIEKRENIWEAVKFLTGVDLKDLDGSYLHSVENFTNFFAQINCNSKWRCCINQLLKRSSVAVLKNYLPK